MQPQRMITVVNTTTAPIGGSGVLLQPGANQNITEKNFARAFFGADGKSPAEHTKRFFERRGDNPPALIVICARAIPSLNNDYATLAVSQATVEDVGTLRAVTMVETREAVLKAISSKLEALSPAAPQVAPSVAEQVAVEPPRVPMPEGRASRPAGQIVVSGSAPDELMRRGPIADENEPSPARPLLAESPRAWTAQVEHVPPSAGNGEEPHARGVGPSSASPPAVPAAEKPTQPPSVPAPSSATAPAPPPTSSVELGNGGRGGDEGQSVVTTAPRGRRRQSQA